MKNTDNLESGSGRDNSRTTPNTGNTKETIGATYLFVKYASLPLTFVFGFGCFLSGFAISRATLVCQYAVPNVVMILAIAIQAFSLIIIVLVYKSKRRLQEKTQDE